MNIIVSILISIFLGIYVLFLPGFIISFVFFRRKGIELIERIALSFALSIAVVPLIAFYLNLLGIKLTSFSVSIQIALIIVISLIVILLKILLRKKPETYEKN